MVVPVTGLLGAPGGFDTGFGNGGGIVVPFSEGDDFAYGLAIQPDGRESAYVRWVIKVE